MQLITGHVVIETTFHHNMKNVNQLGGGGASVMGEAGRLGAEVA